jgi:hypothetical protein
MQAAGGNALDGLDPRFVHRCFTFPVKRVPSPDANYIFQSLSEADDILLQRLEFYIIAPPTISLRGHNEIKHA